MPSFVTPLIASHISSSQPQVQSGGSFDVDWVITDPNDTILLEGERDRQGDYIFTAQSVGEYSFCFSCVSASTSCERGCALSRAATSRP